MCVLPVLYRYDPLSVAELLQNKCIKSVMFATKNQININFGVLFLLERHELPKICRELRGDRFIVSERVWIKHYQNDDLLQQYHWRERNWTESG